MSKTASLKAENLSWFQVKKYLHSSPQRCRTLCPCTPEIAEASSLGSYKNLQLKNRKEKRVKKRIAFVNLQPHNNKKNQRQSKI